MSMNLAGKQAKHDELINVDLKRTIQRVAKDYPGKLDTGLLREWVQNSVDGWCTNSHKRNILGGSQDERPSVRIQWLVNTDEDSLVLRDNAGGMPHEVLKNRFVGVNTPGEEKQKGGQGGSEGRGFYVIANCADFDKNGIVKAETLHTSGVPKMISVNLNTGRTSGVIALDKNESHLDEMGTAIEIPKVKEDVLDQIVDADFFRQTILKWYWNLFNHCDVTATLEVDGEVVEKIKECPFEFNSESRVDTTTEFEKFSYNGKTGVADELHLYDRSDLDFDNNKLPFDDDIQLLKGNEYLDEPYMVVKEYSPNKIPAINKNKVIGYGDVSSLCPQFEKRNHMGLSHGICGLSGIREKISESCQENFTVKDSAKDTEDLESRVKELVNKAYHNSNIESFTGAGGSPKDVPSEVLDEPKVSVLIARPQHEHKPGDKVSVDVEIREDSLGKEWIVDTIEIHRDGEKVDKEDTLDTISTEPDSCNRKTIYEFTPQESARYEFMVSLSSIGSSTIVKNSKMNIYVGDAEPKWSPSPPRPKDTRDTIVEDVAIMHEPQEIWEVGASAIPDGFKAHLNLRHPRLKRIDENHSNEQAIKEQLIELSCLVIDGIKDEKIKQKADNEPEDLENYVKEMQVKTQKLRTKVTQDVMNNE